MLVLDYSCENISNVAIILTISIFPPLAYSDAPSACRKLAFSDEGDSLRHEIRKGRVTASRSCDRILCEEWKIDSNFLMEWELLKGIEILG